jgi:hypothetical protein
LDDGASLVEIAGSDVTLAKNLQPTAMTMQNAATMVE